MKPTGPGECRLPDESGSAEAGPGSGNCATPDGATKRYRDLRDRAFDEYCDRLEAGERLDLEEFASQYPACKSSLMRMLVTHDYMERHPHLWAKQESEMPRPPDTLLGFRLLRELGKGAFSRVFLAEQPDIGGRLVVLKVSPFRASEANTLGRVEHPNIVMVHSVGDDPDSGLSVLCMPFLGRATLHDVLDRVKNGASRPRRADIFAAAIEDGALPEQAASAVPEPCQLFRHGSYVDAVLDVARQLTEALCFVHARGICHRDLKPSNILLGQNGRPMLLDFNLSADVRAVEQPRGGTLPYMSPEQLGSLAEKHSEHVPTVDGRSDLYSLGVILHELLTGEHPFGPIEWGLSDKQLLDLLLERQQQGIRRPMHRLNAQIDGSLERLIARCLAFEPDDRFASAEELLVALKSCQSPAGRAFRWARTHPVLVSVAIGLLVLGSVAGAVVHTDPTLDAALAVSKDIRPLLARDLERGIKAYKAKDYQRAVETLSNVIEAQDHSVEARYSRGRSFLKLPIPNYEKAREDFIRAEQLAQADPLSRDDLGKIQGCAAYTFGLCAERNTFWNEGALDYCEKAIRAEFAKAIMYNNKGYLLARQSGQGQTALRSLDQAIDLDGGLRAAYHNQATIDLVLATRKKDNPYPPERGVIAIEKALCLKPATPKVHYDAFLLYICMYQAKKEKQFISRAEAQLKELIVNGWLSKEMVEDPFLMAVRSRLSFVLPDAIKSNKDLPRTLLFLDPVAD